MLTQVSQLVVNGTAVDSGCIKVETGTSLIRQKNEHPVTIVRDAKDFVASLPPEYAGR